MHLTLWILIHSCTPTYLTPSLSILHTTSRIRNTTSTQRQALLHPHSSAYTPQTYLLPKHTQLITCADDITIIASHSNTQTLKAQIQPYLHSTHAWTKQSQTQLKQNVSYTFVLMILRNITHIPDMHTHPNILSLTLDPKFTYNKFTILQPKYSNLYQFSPELTS